MPLQDADLLFREGRLDDAIAALGDSLREDPSDGRARMFLVELLCFAGEFERARRLLEGVSLTDPELLMGVGAFQSGLSALMERAEMFGSGNLPETDGELSDVTGTLNGNPFESLRDGDPRLGPRFEAIVNGAYTWIPMRHVARLSAEAPARLRDLFWITAEVQFAEEVGGQLNDIILPAMTAEAPSDSDDQVRLGRVTEWVELESGEEIPLGQKLLVAGGEEVSLLEVREIVISQPGD